MIQQTMFDSLPNSKTPIDTLRTVGELRKLKGMQQAADNKAEAVAFGQVSFLLALLKSENGTATIYDGTVDLAATFSDGGKWRGSVVAGFARRRIVERVAVVLSDRPARHRGFVSRWRLLDRDKDQQELDRLLAWLTPKENPLSAATDAGNETCNTNSKSGENENASV